MDIAGEAHRHGYTVSAVRDRVIEIVGHGACVQMRDDDEAAFDHLMQSHDDRLEQAADGWPIPAQKERTP